jgi:hypothetical protein
MGIRRDELDAAQAASGQAAQEVHPERRASLCPMIMPSTSQEGDTDQIKPSEVRVNRARHTPSNRVGAPQPRQIKIVLIGGELVAVHQLFREFAITRGQNRAGELALIDVEARFAPAPAEGLRGGMIDLVFLLPDCRLLFIEAKCIGNRDLLSTKVAPVVAQVRNYECHIVRGGVLDAMNRSLCLQSRLIGHDLGQAKSIAVRVPVLILDPDHRGLSLHPRDRWLKKALAIPPNWSFDPDEVAVIDGMSNPSVAIRAYVCAFVAKFPA